MPYQLYIKRLPIKICRHYWFKDLYGSIVSKIDTFIYGIIRHSKQASRKTLLNAQGQKMQFYQNIVQF